MFCEALGCDREARVRGWCPGHYNRWQHGRVVDGPIVQRTPSGAPCAIDGCGDPSMARGWCPKHYNRWQRNGDPEKTMRVQKYDGQLCGHPGCSDPARAKGLCAKHWGRLRKHGDPSADFTRKCAVCSHPSKELIELRIRSRERYADIASSEGLTVHKIQGHAQSHMIDSGPVWRGQPCKVCQHPDIQLIDELLLQRLELSGTQSRRYPKHLQLGVMAQRFGFRSASSFTRHLKPGHQATRATYELARLKALDDIA